MTGPMPEVGVKFRADGLDGVRRGLKVVKDEAAPTGRQWGMASRQIASGLEGVARTGKLAGESLKQVISNGAEMAFMFGAGGPIVAAIGITGLAIFQGITSRMKEAREEARKFAEEVAGVRRAGNLEGAGDLSQRLYSGDRFAVQREGEGDREFRARQGGVLGIRADIARLRNIQTSGATQRDRITAFNEIAKLLPLLEQYEDRARAAASAVAELAAAEGARLVNINNAFGGPALATNRAGGVADIALPGLARGMRPNATSMLPINAMGIGAARPEDSPATLAMVEGMKRVAEIAGQGFVDTLASTIETGIARVFQKGANIGTGFAAIAETALAGLGSIATQIGRAALTQFTFISTIAKAIAGLNPAIGIPAAIALIAFGSALGGAGSRIGANAAGSGGYGGYSAGSGYGAAIIDRGIIDPTRGGGVTARNSNVYHFTVLGTNDPTLKRQIIELLDGADRRGRV